MTELTEREKFEMWATAQFNLTSKHLQKDEYGNYLNYSIHHHWYMWQVENDLITLKGPEQDKAALEMQESTK